jgi:hypothetical protein
VKCKLYRREARYHEASCVRRTTRQGTVCVLDTEAATCHWHRVGHPLAVDIVVAASHAR